MPSKMEGQASVPITVVHIITTLELGGAQQNTLYTVSHLDPARYKAVLLAGPEGLLWPEARTLDGVAVYCIDALQRRIHPIRDLVALWCIFRILHRLKRHSQLIVHTHSSKAGILGRLAARVAGISVIIHSIHGYGFHTQQSRVLQRILVAVEWVMARITTRFIAVAQANIVQGEALGLFRRAGVDLIRSGIRIRSGQFENDDAVNIRKSLGVSESAALVGMVACLKPQKAPLDFVELAARVRNEIPDVRFLLVGDGDLRPDVERLVHTIGLERTVILAGWRRDVPEILNALDVFVLTSRWEGLPRVVLEAIAAGTPVVATAVDGTVEALERIADGTRGYLVAPGDLSTMADRVVGIINHQPDAPIKSRHDGILPAEFDIDTMVRQQIHLYDELLIEQGMLEAV
ncbi:MAG TPA: glycosyltransferase family 1 protein [Nitrospirales bacterium]|nr:glycosyltransferase family 1 protein [Nitrospirales bacterium]HIC04704.1 glycosyltransferase family 1 protein [Nitrospirales bacterium]